MGWLKNTPQNIPFVLINRSTGDALTNATAIVKRLKDGGSQETADGIVTEKGGGQYSFAASAADMNATVVGFLITAENAIPVHITLKTEDQQSVVVQTYGGVGIGVTLEAQLLSVQAAIAAIEAGAQAVSSDSDTVTRASIAILYSREERLRREIGRANRGRISVAEF